MPARALLLPHLGRALPRAGRRRVEHPEVDSPNGGYDGFPEKYRRGDGSQELLRPQAVQPLRALALRAGLPGRRDVREPGRRRAGGQDLLPRLPLLRAGLPLRLPLHRPAHQARSTSAPSATTASRRGSPPPAARPARPRRGMLGDLKNPKDPIHEFLRTHKVQVLKPQMATGLEDLLQRPRRLGAVGRAPMESMPARRRRVHVPERDGAPVEHPDRALPVHHRPGGGRLHPRLARARLPRRGGEARPTGWRC